MAETLAVHMARAKFRRGDLARAAGVSAEVISKALRGETVSRETAEAISRALNVPLYEISDLSYR